MPEKDNDVRNLKNLWQTFCACYEKFISIRKKLISFCEKLFSIHLLFVALFFVIKCCHIIYCTFSLHWDCAARFNLDFSGVYAAALSGYTFLLSLVVMRHLNNVRKVDEVWVFRTFCIFTLFSCVCKAYLRIYWLQTLREFEVLGVFCIFTLLAYWLQTWFGQLVTNFH